MVNESNEGPTIRDTYVTLSPKQKAVLELAITTARNEPFNEDQITLFDYFLNEASNGSMARKRRARRN